MCLFPSQEEETCLSAGCRGGCSSPCQSPRPVSCTPHGLGLTCLQNRASWSYEISEQTYYRWQWSFHKAIVEASLKAHDSDILNAMDVFVISVGLAVRPKSKGSVVVYQAGRNDQPIEFEIPIFRPYVPRTPKGKAIKPTLDTDGITCARENIIRVCMDCST